MAMCWCCFWFLVDTGSPIQQAKDGLARAIGQLAQADHFNIVQFDHEQVVWSPTGPVQATGQNVEQVRIPLPLRNTI